MTLSQETVTLSHESVYGWTGGVLASLRSSLDRLGFVEILPVILSKRYEPGARHSIAVLGDRALPDVEVRNGNGRRPAVTVSGEDYYYLPVSHCVEKQLALEHAERVYCIAPCVRLLMSGENHTGRHLYTFFQAEIEWRTESVDEVLELTESMLYHFAKELRRRVEGTALADDAALERIRSFTATPYERLPFAAARQRVADIGGQVNPHAHGDLTHAEEQALSQTARAPFWLTEYPDGVRDSLYRRQSNSQFATYDLVLPQGHGELATGGLRPDSAEDIRRQAGKLAASPHGYYADWKARTQVQTGGLGFGVERLVRYCCGASSVLDLRFAHDHGPNSHLIEPRASWT